MAQNTTYVDVLTCWFEQCRGVLFVNSQAVQEGLLVTIICVRGVQAAVLAEDAASGLLTAQLEDCLVGDVLLKQLGVKNMKLGVELVAEEIDEAIRELSA